MNREVRKFKQHGWFKDSIVEIHGLEDSNISSDDSTVIMFVIESSIFAFRLRYIISTFFTSIGHMLMFLGADFTKIKKNGLMVTKMYSMDGTSNYAVGKAIKKVKGEADVKIYLHDLMYDVIMDDMLHDKKVTEIK